MKISDIKIGKRFRRDIGNIKSLVKSIQETGILQPIGIDEKRNLIVGYRRLQAYKELGIEDIPITILDIVDPKIAEIDENRERKNFTMKERKEIRDYLRPILEAKAKDRRKTHGKTAAVS